ncbi:MAG TPA: peptidoglycan DD-metalloendopeptidase family protein [Rhodanobacteraceae bacterium]|nr:peptidoglycan DD-metalloendopeptidase family protein [Rhodanobacteraceae bacterium]
MRTLISWSGFLFIGIAAALLGGCATSPAPVVDRSMGGGPGVSQYSQSGDHVNGRMTSAGYVVARGDTLYSIAFTHGLDYRALAARNGIAPPYVIYPGQVLRIDAASPGAPVRSAVAKAPSRETRPPNNAPVFVTVPNQPVPAAHVPPASSTTVAAATRAEASAPPAPVIPVPAAHPPASAAASGAPPAIVSGKTRSVDGITWQWPSDGAVISGFRDGSPGSGAGLDIAGSAGDPVRAAADGVVVYSGNGLIGYGELIIIKHSDTYLSAYGHNRERLVKEGEHVRAGQMIAEMGSSGAPREELHFEIRKNGKPVDPTDYLPGR